jgi:3-methyladenine DNA glycosylase AlkD
MDFFEERFRRQGTRARATGQKAYMKSDLAFFGVTASQVRGAAAEWVRAHPDLDRRQLRAFVETAYGDNFDLRSAAVVVLSRCRKLLGAADAPWIVGLVRRSANWAHVDWLSVHVLGFLVEQHPPLTNKLRRWGRDRDFWVRRAALLSLLGPLRRGEGDFALFAELAEPMLSEKEFFIRKAIGWVLRESGKKRPRLTFAFLSRHRVSGLTFREGSRRLPPTLRARLKPPS